jgi:hypothetical protein
MATATHIFKALRVDRTGLRYAMPQVLGGATDNKPAMGWSAAT